VHGVHQRKSNANRSARIAIFSTSSSRISNAQVVRYLWCHNGITVVLQKCHNGVAVVLHSKAQVVRYCVFVRADVRTVVDDGVEREDVRGCIEESEGGKGGDGVRGRGGRQTEEDKGRERKGG
jgi:hypothetical protein